MPTIKKIISCWLLTFFLAACSKPEAAAVRGGERVIPVAAASVEQRDVPVYLDGLGSATAYQTVNVRSQVDGRLERVFFKEGQTVRRGELLAQVDPRPFINQLHQAEGALARDQATLATNRRDLERYQDLTQRKLIAVQQADQQQGLVAQIEGTVRLDQAAIDVAKLNIDYARIVSPIDGVAGIRNVDPGNLIHASDPTGIVVLTQLDPIAVIFTLPQDVLPQVSLYMGQGELQVVVFSRDGANELGRGKLEVIDNAINVATDTLRLKAILDNPKHALWPNEFVKVRLLLTVKQGAKVVPAPALQRGPQGTFVYVVGKDQTVQARPVQVDLLQGNEALIAQGLEPGEVVVTEGQNQLRPGSKVSLPGAERPRPKPE